MYSIEQLAKKHLYTIPGERIGSPYWEESNIPGGNGGFFIAVYDNNDAAVAKAREVEKEINPEELAFYISFRSKK